MPDPLDYAIDGQPVPDELRDDPEFVRSHAEAAADLDLIREGLGAIAAQAQRSESGPPRRQPKRVLLAAAACLAVLGGGGLWASTLVDRPVDTAAPGAALEDGRSGTESRSVADVGCARLVVRGTVTGVRHPTVRVSVTEQLRPAADDPPKTRTFEVAAPGDWRVGHEVLVVVPRQGELARAIWPHEDPDGAAAAARRARLAPPAECPR